MFSRSTLLQAMLFAAVALITFSTASAAAPNDQPAVNSVNAIRTYLMPDLSLKSVFSAELLPKVDVAAKSRGTCRCSCGFPCETNADCGPGGLCEPFITCCAGRPEAQWFQNADQSSRSTAALPLNIKCK